MISAEEALDRFLRSTASMLVLLEGVSDATWRRRPGDAWSLAETIEHVVTTDRKTLTRLDRGTAPLPAGASRFPDDQITEGMFHGVPAPPGIAEPAGVFATVADGLAALGDVRDGVAAHVRRAGEGLRGVAVAHPVFGLFDGVQWVLFLAAHTDNHRPDVARLVGA
jgi:hypothetical protein